MNRLLILLAALASPAFAQPVEQQEIVVTGRVDPKPKEAQGFVNQITQRSNQQVARFHDPICPAVLGMAAEPAGVIEARIRETAVGIGAAVAPSGNCPVNLLLLIVEDGGALVTSMRSHNPDWLAGLPPVKVRALINEKSPVRAWAVTSLRNEDGQGAVIESDGGPYTMRVSSASIIKLPTRAQIEGSVIVINRSAVVGVSLAQLADYVAMRGLARTRPPSSDRVGTILGLFSPGGGSRPDEMTKADVLYLQSLYASPGTDSAIQQRDRLARAIAGNSK